MVPPTLTPGDTVGIFCPSHIFDPERYAPMLATLERLGFHIKLGENAKKTTYGYLASERERADDLNALVADAAVRMILFGGGEGGNEPLPYIDYDRL